MGKLSLKPRLRLKRGSDSLALSADGRVIFVRREVKLPVSAIAIAYEGGSFGNSKRKNKVRIEKPQMAGRGCAGNFICAPSVPACGQSGSIEVTVWDDPSEAA